MYAFSYCRASSVADVITRLKADPQAKVLAGGMTLLPSMKHRLAAPTQLIDIARLPELRGVRREGPVLRIGAGQRHDEIAADPQVLATLPALADLAGLVGDPQVRARGTIGGSVANNDPAADYPAAVLGFDGVIVTDRRRVPAGEFFQGMFSTALADDEIVVAIELQVPRRAAYRKFAHPASGYAMTGVMVADYGTSVRVAVTGAGPGVFRWAQAEAALTRQFDAAALASLQMPADTLNADLHAPADYRAQLVKVMTTRAVRALTAPSGLSQ